MVGASGFVVPPDWVSLAMLPYSCRRGFAYGRLRADGAPPPSRVFRVSSVVIGPPYLTHPQFDGRYHPHRPDLVGVIRVAGSLPRHDAIVQPPHFDHVREPLAAEHRIAPPAFVGGRSKHG